jgi:hypothetical protein
LDLLTSILNILTIVTIGIVGYFIKNYFPSYFKEKAKNLATKEDLKEITNQVESIKHLYSSDLEALKAQLGSQLFVHQTRYQNEFEILKKLSEKLVKLRNAALGLRPVADYVNPNESEEERKQKRLERYHQAGQDLYEIFETRKPFYPDEIYEGIKKLDQIVWKEVVQYKNRTDCEGKGFDQEYWEKAEANSEEITQEANRVMELIRNRVKYWESLKI